jgi:cbb3-type cytochrome oxidase subunit 3
MSLADIMAAAGLSSWAELALILCFAVFTGIVIWVYFVRRKRSYEHLRRLPLEEGEDDHSTSRGGSKR